MTALQVQDIEHAQLTQLCQCSKIGYDCAHIMINAKMLEFSLVSSTHGKPLPKMNGDCEEMEGLTLCILCDPDLYPIHSCR